MLRSLSASLLRSWPHRPSSLPLPDHWLTQSYFLSATNADGEPLDVRFLGRLETFNADLAKLLRLLGHRAANASSLEHINQSGAARKKKAVRALVEHLPYISPIPPLYLPYISPISPYVSPISPLYLA